MQEKKGKSRKLCYFRCNFGTPFPLWGGFPPKICSRPAGYTQVSHFLHVAPLSLLIIECLRVSGIACTLSGASKALYNRGVHTA